MIMHERTVPRFITFGVHIVMSREACASLPIVDGTPEGIDGLPLGTIGRAHFDRGHATGWHAVQREHGTNGEIYLASEIRFATFALDSD